MNRQELMERLKQCAHRRVKLALALPDDPFGRHIKSQLIRCSTGAAANYRAAGIAQSRAAWVSKLSSAIEEADESCIWMEFLLEEGLLSEKKMRPLLTEGQEFPSILIAARQTARRI